MTASQDLYAKRFDAIFCNVDERFKRFCAERQRECKDEVPASPDAACQCARINAACDKFECARINAECDKFECARINAACDKFDGVLQLNTATVISAKKQLISLPPAPAMEPETPPAFCSLLHSRPSTGPPASTGLHKLKWTEDTRFRRPIYRAQCGVRGGGEGQHRTSPQAVQSQSRQRHRCASSPQHKWPRTPCTTSLA